MSDVAGSGARTGATSTGAAHTGATSTGAARSGFPSGWAVLRAELGRSRRTFTWWVGAVVVLFGLHALLVAQGTGTATGWNGGVMAWLSLYPDAFALPIGALVGAMAQWREVRHRAGGTAWRAVRPSQVLGGRVVVLAASALVCQVMLLAPVVGSALLRGAGWGPWHDWFAFGVVMWVHVTAAGVWGMALVRWVGGAAVGLAPAAAMVWSVAGSVRAESATWWAEPWTWAVRPTLPLLGVHGNGVGLEPGSPVWDYPVWPGVLLGLLTGVLGVAAAALGQRLRGAGGFSAAAPTSGAGLRNRTAPTARAVTGAPAVGPARQPLATVTAPTVQAPAPPPSTSRQPRATVTVPTAPARRRSLLAAMALTLPWGLWAGLAVLLTALLGVTRTVYTGGYALGLLALVGVPAAACVVGIISWTAQAAAWRSLVLRARPVELTGALAALMGLFLLPVLVTDWAVSGWGAPLTHTEPGAGAFSSAVYALLVLPFVALMVAAVSHALARCAGTVVAIVVAVAGLLEGVLVGGNDILSRSFLWLAAPWAWVQVAAQYPQRWPVVALLSLVIALASLGLAAGLGRRVALRD